MALFQVVLDHTITFAAVITVRAASRREALRRFHRQVDRSGVDAPFEIDLGRPWRIRDETDSEPRVTPLSAGRRKRRPCRIER